MALVARQDINQGERISISGKEVEMKEKVKLLPGQQWQKYRRRLL
jgi:hypothetical protein